MARSTRAAPGGSPSVSVPGYPSCARDPAQPPDGRSARRPRRARLQHGRAHARAPRPQRAAAGRRAAHRAVRVDPHALHAVPDRRGISLPRAARRARDLRPAPLARHPLPSRRRHGGGAAGGHGGEDRNARRRCPRARSLTFHRALLASDRRAMLASAPPSWLQAVRRTLLLITAWVTLTVLLWPALIGRDILGFRDMLHNYAPMRELFWQGDISLWNDRAFGGSSVLADIVQQPFYLGQLLMRAIHAPAWPGISIRLWIHELLGMAAIWRLLRRFVPPDAAGIGAVAFRLCGVSLPHFSNPQWVCAQMWAPTLLLAADARAGEGGFARG